MCGLVDKICCFLDSLVIQNSGVVGRPRGGGCIARTQTCGARTDGAVACANVGTHARTIARMIAPLHTHMHARTHKRTHICTQAEHEQTVQSLKEEVLALRTERDGILCALACVRTCASGRPCVHASLCASVHAHARIRVLVRVTYAHFHHCLRVCMRARVRARVCVRACVRTRQACACTHTRKCLQAHSCTRECTCAGLEEEIVLLERTQNGKDVHACTSHTHNHTRTCASIPIHAHIQARMWCRVVGTHTHKRHREVCTHTHMDARMHTCMDARVHRCGGGAAA